MTAPSCSGEFTKKMLRSSSLETSALTTVPVAIWSFRELVRSKTMSAPVLDSDMLAQARTVWFMTDSIVAGAPAAPKKYANLPEPMRSSRRRISGWNITTMAMRPSSTMRRMRLFTILNRAMSEMTSASSMNTMPRASRLAFVRRMRPMQTYMSTATISTSTMSARLIVRRYLKESEK